MGHVVVNVFDLIVQDERTGRPIHYDHNNIPYFEKAHKVMPVPGCVNPTGTLTLHLIFYPLFTCPKGFFGGNLILKIHQAENLMAMDKSMFAKAATSSDPYIVVSCPEGESFKANKVANTKTVKKTLSPYFDEQFNIILTENHHPHLFFKIFDWDAVSGDDPIGQAIVDLYDLQAEVRCGEW